MAKEQRIHVQAFNFKDLCNFIDSYSKQGYSVVDSDKLAETPQHTGRIYSCWMTLENEGVVVEEKSEEAPKPAEELDAGEEEEAAKWGSGELGQSEEHVVVSEQVVLETMTKKELEEYALEKFGVDLDRRMSKTKLIAEIKKLD